MRRSRALFLAYVVLSSIAVVPGGAGASSSSAAIVKQVQDPQKALEYWTPSRMASATPMALEEIDGDELTAGTVPQGGEPVLVEGRDAETFASQTSAPLSALAPQPGPLEFERSQVLDPSVAPYVTHGIVFGRAPQGFGFACSGTSVSSAARNLVWTAGHCLSDQGAFSTQLIFVPGYQDRNEPFGRWAAEAVFVPPQWAQKDDLEYDFGAFTTVPNENGVLGDVVGSRGIAFNQHPTEFFESFGYPALPQHLGFDGEHMQTCRSQGSGRVTAGVISMGCDMEEGSSGGGWIMREGYLASNQSGGNMAIWPNIAHGPYLGQAAKEMYESLNGSAATPQPTPTGPATPLKTHKMAITLILRDHLVAKGRLTATDGFSKCADNTPIHLGKLRGDTYYPVGELAFTNAEGRFAVPLPDQRGKYLVAADPGPYDLSNKCTKAYGFGTHRH